MLVGKENKEVYGSKWFEKGDYANISALSALICCSNFINKVFNFLGIGVALYTVALVYGWASSDSVIKHTVKCKFCRKRISEKVRFALFFFFFFFCSPLGASESGFSDDGVVGATVCELYELAGWSGAVSVEGRGV